VISEPARDAPTSAELLELFVEAAAVARDAVGSVTGAARRRRTDRPGQYALDVVADAAVLEVLHRADVSVMSEESGLTGPPDAPITIVLDPVDGSTNCSRDLPYWAISLCALDEAGMLCSLVTNQATGSQTIAVRGLGAHRDGVRLTASTVSELSRAVIALGGVPEPSLGWKQCRMLGSGALALCDLAAGGLDGYLDTRSSSAPWDYLGGLLACVEAGATVVDATGRDLVVAGFDDRRHLVGASTTPLLAQLRPGGSS
jgi:fructose-1,6-bisphosphatase/inositol monophosphatase family enzyme